MLESSIVHVSMALTWTIANPELKLLAQRFSSCSYKSYFEEGKMKDCRDMGRQNAKIFEYTYN